MKEKQMKVAQEILNHFGLESSDLEGIKHNGVPVNFRENDGKFSTYDKYMKIIDKKLKEFEKSDDTVCFYVDVCYPLINYMLATQEDVDCGFYKQSLKSNVVFCYVENLERSEFSEYGDCAFKKDGNFLSREIRNKVIVF